MSKRTFNLCLLLVMGAFMLSLVQSAEAARGPRGPRGPRHPRPQPEVDPAAIAKRCVASMERTVEVNDKIIAKVVERAVKRIKQAVADGDQNKADDLAERYSKYVTRRTKRVATGLERSCARCVKALEHAEADQALIDRVKAACDAAVDKVNKTKERALAVLAAAAGGGGS